MDESRTGKNQSLLQRLRNAGAGLWHALQSERSLRFHALALLLVIIGLVILRPGALWTALVLLAAAGVIAAELMNTALEALADLLHPGEHPQIRIAKDCAAAAVLIASIAAVVVAIALAVQRFA
jgi:diacylglycerol kinase (ATP)